MLCISLFVASTVALLAYLVAYQGINLRDTDYGDFAPADVHITFVLQGQTIMAE